MKLCKPLFEIWEQSAGLEGVYKQIEKVGRVCYKSEDKITEDSAKPFVDRMVKSDHGSMLEHGTVYLKITYKDTDFTTLCMFYGKNKYSVLNHSEDNKIYYITTNYRVLVENSHLSDLKYLCKPTEFHEKRICVKFICDRGILAEFTRHRTFSFSAESTRYCNYSKDKFGNELTFIIPNWVNTHCPNKEQEGPSVPDMKWSSAMLNAEASYKILLKMGWTPQQARAVLPNSLKTELVMTGFVSDWKHFFRIRSRIAETGKPHPQAQELADPLMDEFVKRGIMETLL